MLRSAAWAVPVVAVAVAAPAAAASTTGTLRITSTDYDPSQAWGAYAAGTLDPVYSGTLTEGMLSFDHPVTVTRWTTVSEGRVFQLFFMPDDRSLPGVRATITVPGYAPLVHQFGSPS